MPSKTKLLQWSWFRKWKKRKYIHPPAIPCPYSITELELYLSVIQEKLRNLIYSRKVFLNRKTIDILERDQEYILEDIEDERPWFIRPDMLFLVPMDTEQDIIKAKLMRDILAKEKMISILLINT